MRDSELMLFLHRVLETAGDRNDMTCAVQAAELVKIMLAIEAGESIILPDYEFVEYVCQDRAAQRYWDRVRESMPAAG